MKKLSLALSVILLLSGCAQTPPTTASPTPSLPVQTASPSDAPSPEPSQAPLWSTLTIDSLPDEPVDLGDFFLFSSPQICLLAQIPELDVAFYGLNPGYGGGILFRDGDTLLHFEQGFGALPEVRQGNFSGGEAPELAVLWPLSRDSMTYDLVFYRPLEEGWTACSISRDTCIELVEQDLDLQWDSGTHTLTLSLNGQSAVRQFPQDTAPGRLTLGHMCLFYESQGSFYMTMDAWSDLLGESLAVFRAEVSYDGEDFSLKNLQMGSMVGV